MDEGRARPTLTTTKLHEALTKAGSPSLLIPVTDGGHGFYSPEIVKRMGQFFDMHLRGIKSEISSDPVTAVARPVPAKK